MHEKVTYLLTDIGPTSREGERGEGMCGRVLAILCCLFLKRKLKQL